MSRHLYPRASSTFDLYWPNDREPTHCVEVYENERTYIGYDDDGCPKFGPRSVTVERGWVLRDADTEDDPMTDEECEDFEVTHERWCLDWLDDLYADRAERAYEFALESR